MAAATKKTAKDSSADKKHASKDSDPHAGPIPSTSKPVDALPGGGMGLETNKFRNADDPEQAGVTSNPLAVEPRLRGVVQNFPGPNASGKVRAMSASGKVISVSGNNLTIASSKAAKDDGKSPLRKGVDNLSPAVEPKAMSSIGGDPKSHHSFSPEAQDRYTQEKTSHAVSSDADITLNGSKCFLADLIIDDEVSIEGDPAIRVTATR